MALKRALISLSHYLIVLPFILLAAVTAGLCFAPGVFLFEHTAEWRASFAPPLQYCITGMILVTAYLLYGFTLIVIAPLFNLILGGRLSPYRGPAVSVGALRWYIHCCFTLLPRLSFLEFITPSPFNVLFYRLMGMKVGHSVAINSTAIADPSLIELGDYVTVGGSASITAHYGQGGYLVIAPVKICNKATIGLRAIIMGGVQIGEGAKVLAGSFVLPNTQIPAGETWGGIPAVRIELNRSKIEQE
jgi:non-ribosomal peptide synthetase-like protein